MSSAERIKMGNTVLEFSPDFVLQTWPKWNKQSCYRGRYLYDQRSPLNQEGRIIYDRNFLLQFSSNCVSKPKGLPNLPDIVLDKPAIMSSAERIKMGNTVLEFSPDFVLQTRPEWNAPQISNKQSYYGGQYLYGGPPNRGGPQQNIHHFGYELNTVTSKPVCNMDLSNTKTTKEIYKHVNGILNELTPGNFKTLSKEVQELNIDTETRLKGVTDLIFEKAVSEPAFSVAYANLCRDLMQHVKVPSDSKPGEKIDCRVILLTKCQREFEKDKDLDLETGQKKIDEGDSEDVKKQLQEEMEIAVTTARRRSIANIRFLGELFQLTMFTKTAVRDCVSKLLQSKDEINLECLSILLTIIGKELDTVTTKSEIDQYFQEIQEIVTEKKTSSRVRFMLQDVIDLRSCNWVPRREDNNPKTIDQIHKEDAKESEQTNFLESQNPSQC
ncbi:eukaryotic translation initiation factor 4 gamma 1-like isoform X2 [Patella vulgata]|uniref:eukaryotic translation initiation factor 4 gamma 1-like isoform X2 n=1 Tax=Patella vulgata TaxID=6465 RepID=UPI0024A90974|nr:eukaryotic translation initiation factor 4 gamma 1-like isoform X2 [Patella vulgata]